MSEVKSIFGEFEKVNATDDENYILDSCREFVDESLKLINILIVENDRHKNNQRWYASKSIIQSGMTLLIMHQKLIEALIDVYKREHGFTSIINRIEYLFRDSINLNQKTMKPYLYLIDFNDCEKRMMVF
jgi:hypothetical protein|tara:strand:- start:772 stop:1161 length:390 start_codon:yes stop_codon:yes gene_type:complete